MKLLNLFTRKNKKTEPIDPVVDEDVFVDKSDNPGPLTLAQSLDTDGLLGDLFRRDHYAMGYNAGSELGDPALIESYAERMQGEIRHRLERGLLNLRQRISELSEQDNELNEQHDAYLRRVYKTRLKKLQMLEERILDELDASMLGGGRLSLIKKEYRDGFLRGVHDADSHLNEFETFKV